MSQSNITPGKTWRKDREEGVEITLPYSGYTVALRPVSVDFFIRHGSIPDMIAETVRKMIDGEEYVVQIPKEANDKDQEWMTFLDQLVACAFASPQIVDVPLSGREVSVPQADDEISVDDVLYTDKLFVYKFFTQSAQTLRAFRQRQADAVASVVSPERDGRASIEDAPSEPVGSAQYRDEGLLDRATVR